MRTTASLFFRTYVVLSVITIVLLLAWVGVLLNNDPQETQKPNGLEILRQNGYNIIDTKVEIANPGNVPGVVTETLELTIDKNDEIYIVDPGDYDATELCVDRRDEMISRAGGFEKTTGVSLTLEGCNH